MDSGLEERRLPSIRRSQILLIYRNGGVVHLETLGQIACSVGRLPIRFTVGTGGTIRMRIHISGQTQGSAPTPKIPGCRGNPPWLPVCLRNNVGRD